VSAAATFSIVVPTYRRPERLASCLEALAALDYPRDSFEVIVVNDDGSESLSRPEVARGGSGIGTAFVTQPHAGPAAARNTGAEHAGGRYLAFTDDDCLPDSGWLRALAARFADCPDHLVGGRTVNAFPDNPYSSATQVLVDYLSEWQTEHGPAAFFASSNLAVPTERFHALQGFHQGFALAAGEDREFCLRWARAGGRMSYAADAIIRHANRLTLRSFWRQHVRYGRGALQLRRLRGREGERDRPPLAFYLGLVAHPVWRPRDGRRLSLVALLALAQVATLAGYWRERFRRPSSVSRGAHRRFDASGRAARLPSTRTVDSPSSPADGRRGRFRGRPPQ
jgi:GT2 family glycosyltransferase